jgi:hypothetical protein
MEEAARSVSHLRTSSLSVHPRQSCLHPRVTGEAARFVSPLRTTRVSVHPRQSCPHPQLTEEAARSVSHLRTHLRTMSLSVHPRQSCPHPQLTEGAARLPIPHRKANPTSYLQRSRLTPELKEVAVPLVNPWETACPCAEFEQSCLRPELKEAAAQLADLHQPLNPTVHLRHCPHPEPAGVGVRQLVPRRTMNSTVQLYPSCLRSELMEVAAQLANHSYRAPL